MPNCFVLKCRNSNSSYKNTNLGLNFYAIPKRLETEWLHAIGRDPLTVVIGQRVCSEHFVEGDFEKVGGLRELKPMVVPTRNLPKVSRIVISNKPTVTSTNRVQETLPLQKFENEVFSENETIRQYIESLPDEAEMFEIEMAKDKLTQHSTTSDSEISNCSTDKTLKKSSKTPTKSKKAKSASEKSDGSSDDKYEQMLSSMKTSTHFFKTEISISSASDEESSTNPDLSPETAMQMLPEASKKKYEECYKRCVKWYTEKNYKAPSEIILLEYFGELNEKYKSSTLWAIYSMLRATILLKQNINIATFYKLRLFLKKAAKSYQPQKSKTFTNAEIEKFLAVAPDDKFLLYKVVLVIALSGACRKIELCRMRLDQIEDLNTTFLVKIPDSKSKMVRSFTITGSFYNICKKYIDLRPMHQKDSRLFLNFQNGRCTRQPVGKNKLGNAPRLIAQYLKLPEPEKYTGHSFKRTSASLLVNGDGGLVTLKRHSGGRTSAVAEGYINRALGNILDESTSLNFDQTHQTDENVIKQEGPSQTVVASTVPSNSPGNIVNQSVTSSSSQNPYQEEFKVVLDTLKQQVEVLQHLLMAQQQSSQNAVGGGGQNQGPARWNPGAPTMESPVIINVHAERQHFLLRVQRPNEPLANYIADLKAISQKCQWFCPEQNCGRQIDSIFQSQFIRGIRDAQIKEMVLQLEATSTLENILDAALGMEAAWKGNVRGNVEEYIKEPNYGYFYRY